jgi:uncharacterized membrane protein YfcA
MPSGRAAPALVIGLVAGVASGLLGVGGGVIMVPGLVLALRATQHEAHATSLAAIIPIGAVGFALFAAHGEVNYAMGALLVAGSVVGAPLGVNAMQRVPERPLALVFATVMAVAGIRLLS